MKICQSCRCVPAIDLATSCSQVLGGNLVFSQHCPTGLRRNEICTSPCSMAERCSVSTVAPMRRRDFAITSPVAHAAATWRRCPLEAICACPRVCVRERIWWPIIALLKKAVARAGGPDEVKQALRNAASGGNPFLDACRIAEFRWSKWQDKREFQPGSLKTKVEIHGSSLKAFSSTKQRRWSSHVLSVHPGGAKAMNSLPLGKARETWSTNMLSRPGRDMVGWRLAWRGAERHGAAWDEHRERTRRRKWNGPVVAWRNKCATTTQTSCGRFASRLHSSSRACTVSFQTSRCASSGHAVHLSVPCSPPRQFAPCSWVPPSLFGLGATQNGLMTMAAPTFSPRPRTSTRFTEQGHVKTATPYW